MEQNHRRENGWLLKREDKEEMDLKCFKGEKGKVPIGEEAADRQKDDKDKSTSQKGIIILIH